MHAALLRQQLAAFLSPAELPDDDASFLLDQRKRYTSTDCVVVQPASVENVQKTVRFCAQHRIAITPQGGNTGLVGGSGQRVQGCDLGGLGTLGEFDGVAETARGDELPVA